MPKKTSSATRSPRQNTVQNKDFHLELINAAQKLAWAAFQQHDVLFLVGPAGCGKTFLATAFAVKSFLAKECSKIVLTRPIVESGEKLGFLPGTFEDKVNPYMMPMYDCMDKLIGQRGPYREKILSGCEVAPLAYMRGRSQPLDSKILTPNGYRLMGELEIGDYVIGKNGSPIRVIKIYPQGELDVYKVTFSDGVYVECSADHLWNTMTLSEKRHDRGFSTKTTTQIMNSVKTKHHQFNHRIPICSSINFEQKTELPLSPYFLGVMLGNGDFHDNANYTMTGVDSEIIHKINKELPEKCELVKVEHEEKHAPTYRIINRSSFNIQKTISLLGLRDTKSVNKFIPDVYKLSSVKSRLEILRGLMDSHGSCFVQQGKREPIVRFYSASKQLAYDVAFLVNSLGGTSSVRKREFLKKDEHEFHGRIVRQNHPKWMIDIRMLENPFHLKRKADLFVPIQPIRTIVSVEKVSKKECQCIRVDAEDHLYLADHCVVTHNTFDKSICILDEAQNCTISQIKMFLTRFGVDSKIIVTGDPNQSDIPGPCALAETVNKLSDLPGIGIVEFKNNSIVRHPLINGILNRLSG